MSISVISVSSDSSEESVRTLAGRVILFGTIPTTISDTTPTVTPPTTHIGTTLTTTEIPTVSPIVPSSLNYTPASPDYSPISNTEIDPLEDPSSNHIPPLPATSLFLSLTGDSSDSDTPDTSPSTTYGTPFTEITLSTHRSPAASGALHHPFTFDDLLETLSDSSLDDLSDSASGHSSLDHSSAALPSIPRETSLKDDVVVRGSDKPYSEHDINPEIQAKTDDCIAYADVLRVEGIDARVVVETISREKVETGMRGLVEVRVKRVMNPVMLDDISEPGQTEGAIKGTYEMLGYMVQRFCWFQCILDLA
nr:hypothetical protein [Tanacetum cinerariifolium]